jgi:hypothetical protein
MSPLNAVIKLSDAQRRFLLDKRPYVKGGYHSPAVRTMRALAAKGLITFTAYYGLGIDAYETELTKQGRAVRSKLARPKPLREPR